MFSKLTLAAMKLGQHVTIALSVGNLKEKMKISLKNNTKQTGVIRYFYVKNGKNIAVVLWDNDPSFKLNDEVDPKDLTPSN